MNSNETDTEELEPVNCTRCGRLLTAPRSIRRGIGAAGRRRLRMAERKVVEGEM